MVENVTVALGPDAERTLVLTITGTVDQVATLAGVLNATIASLQAPKTGLKKKPCGCGGK